MQRTQEILNSYKTSLLALQIPIATLLPPSSFLTLCHEVFGTDLFRKASKFIFSDVLTIQTSKRGPIFDTRNGVQTKTPEIVSQRFRKSQIKVLSNPYRRVSFSSASACILCNFNCHQVSISYNFLIHHYQPETEKPLCSSLYLWGFCRENLSK